MREPPIFWSQSGPIQSFSCAVLFIAASDRLSKAIVVSLTAIFVYALAPMLVRLASRAVPVRLRAFLNVVSLSALAAIFSRIASIFWPVLAGELSLYLGAVPLCFLASGLVGVSESSEGLHASAVSLVEATILAAVTIALSLIREPLAYGVLSIPSVDGYDLIFSSRFLGDIALRGLATSAGAFLLLAYFLALFRRIRFRLYGISVCGEDAR